jgi:hypothetical protein
MTLSKAALTTARAAAFEIAGSAVPARRDPRKILGSAAMDAGTTIDTLLVPAVPANSNYSDKPRSRTTGTTSSWRTLPAARRATHLAGMSTQRVGFGLSPSAARSA